jgi:hypothetical protein
MWIVRIALDRPYTFIVLALLILILSPVVIFRTPTDIFPNINIPVVAVAWTYTGLNPEEMEGRVTTVYERVLTTLVDNIEHIESTTVKAAQEEARNKSKSVKKTSDTTAKAKPSEEKEADKKEETKVPVPPSLPGLFDSPAAVAPTSCGPAPSATDMDEESELLAEMSEAEHDNDAEEAA